MFLRCSLYNFWLSGLQLNVSFCCCFCKYIYLLFLFVNKKCFGSKTADFISKLCVVTQLVKIDFRYSKKFRWFKSYHFKRCRLLVEERHIVTKKLSFIAQVNTYKVSIVPKQNSATSF